MRIILVFVLLFTLAGCSDTPGPAPTGETHLYAVQSRIGMVLNVDMHDIAWVRMQPDEILPLPVSEGMRECIERNAAQGVRTFVDVGRTGEVDFIIEEVTSQYPPP